ncbi:MAG: OsmC family protein [Endomicrobia bacterium]|nr:OsmC family protein [Endomicrobiia bacterium]
MIIAESGQEKYLTQLSNGAVNITADTTGNNGGSGEYFRPHDLLCAGLASCLNISIRMVLEKMNLKYDKVIAKVDVNRTKEDSTIFLYHVEIIGDINAYTKEDVISKAMNCPVRKTLSKNISFQPM